MLFVPGDEDEDRDAILGRRSRLIALALTGLVSGSAQACACLGVVRVEHDAGRDGGASADAATDDASVSQDGGPLPCLAPLPPDAGGSDSGA